MINTAIFILVVSSAVLLHDVSARAADVSMGISVFLIGWILLLQLENSSDGQIASMFDKRSANEKEGDLPQARAITCRHVSSKTHCNWQRLWK